LGCLFDSDGLDVRAHKIDRERPSSRRFSATTLSPAILLAVLNRCVSTIDAEAD